MHVTPQRPAGASPMDWKPVQLGRCGSTYGGISGKGKKDFGHGTARYVTFLNVLENAIIQPALFEAVDIGPAETQNRVRRGDLLFNGTSETPEDVALGACVLDDWDDLYLNSFCFGFRFHADTDHDPVFFAYFFRGPTGRQLMSALAQGATRYNMSKRQFLRLECALPNGDEQREIAKALSDIDRLIESLDALIAKKRAIKQATMQQLLTGKTRLPGFTEDWEPTRLDRCGSTYGGITGKGKADFGHGAARYVTFLNVLENAIIQPSMFEAVDIGPAETQNRVRRGDLLFNGTSETPEDVALGACVLDDWDDLYLNSFCFGFRFHADTDHDPLFFAYFFRGSMGRQLMSALAQGATRYNMSKRQFLRLECSLPGGDEQREIAQVLADMDKEIAVIQQRRDKTRAIKQGMMQQLLTGRIRLVKPRGAQAAC